MKSLPVEGERLGDALSSRRIARELAGLFRSGRVEGLRGGGGGGAEVAEAAGTVRVGGVAEVADDGGHAALLGFGECDHAVDLGAAEGDLGLVGGAPGCGRCGVGRRRACCIRKTHVAGEVDGGCAVGDEFFDGLGEAVEVHLETLGERVGHEEVVGEDGGDAGEVGGGRVVALEEELVNLAVGVAVEEDGAAGQPSRPARPISW